ncbi:MAG: formimidoylglutamate deiminase [Pseudomonadota bacterium]
MQTISAEQALLPGGWHRDVRVRVDDQGRIAEVAPGQGDAPAGILLPAPGNLHSHAFQRAMAGLTEARGPQGSDSFWTWRQLMYRFLDHLTPEDVEAIAALAQVEMMEAGFAACGEFHYLHHQPDGTRYDDPAELSARIAAAAAETGIGLTHLPVLYMQGGTDGRALEGGQRRFGNDLEGFARLLEGASEALAFLAADTVLGVAPHSLRAVTVDALTEAARLRPDEPFHLHIAEQRAEVVEVLAAHGATPVKWLLEIMDVDPRWCLIHATQMSPEETLGLARSGAVAGLCPITEANLGDGIFDGARFQEAGGRFGVGSDSNIRISLTGELRSLEYSQRLRDRGRALLAEEARSTGRVLLQSVCEGGAQAMGRDSGAIEVGKWADLMRLDTTDLDLEGLESDTALDAWIFAGGTGRVRDLWSAGRHQVRDGRHTARDRVEARYRPVARRLRHAL